MEQSPEQLALEAGKVFTPAVPVSDKDLFSGRTREIRRIVDAINQRGQHAVIFGDRGVGKTSLTNIISSKLTAGIPIVAPHVTCDSTDDFSSLWRKVLSEIDLSQKKQRSDFQLSIFEETRSAADVIGPRVAPDDLRRLFSLMGEAKLVILILDEFDRVLDRQVRRAVADTIKTFSDHAVPATIIIVGVASTIEGLIEAHESIERSMVQVQMPRMDSSELIDVLHKGTSRLNMRIHNDAARFIATLSQGLPHYTHLLGLHAARIALDQSSFHEITIEHVQDAITRAVADIQGSLRSDFRRAIASPQQASLFNEVLLAAALVRPDEFGFFSPSQVREPLSRIMNKAYDIPSFVRHLKEFCKDERGEVLERAGEKHKVRYRFANALMPPLVIMKGLIDNLITPSDLDAMQA